MRPERRPANPDPLLEPLSGDLRVQITRQRGVDRQDSVGIKPLASSSATVVADDLHRVEVRATAQLGAGDIVGSDVGFSKR